jgi:hypothetical protein
MTRKIIMIPMITPVRIPSVFFLRSMLDYSPSAGIKYLLFIEKSKVFFFNPEYTVLPENFKEESWLIIEKFRSRNQDDRYPCALGF